MLKGYQRQTVAHLRQRPDRPYRFSDAPYQRHMAVSLIHMAVMPMYTARRVFLQEEFLLVCILTARGVHIYMKEAKIQF